MMNIEIKFVVSRTIEMYSFKYKQTTSSYEKCHEVKDGSVMKSIFIFCKMYSLLLPKIVLKKNILVSHQVITQ